MGPVIQKGGGEVYGAQPVADGDPQKAGLIGNRRVPVRFPGTGDKLIHQVFRLGGRVGGDHLPQLGKQVAIVLIGKIQLEALLGDQGPGIQKHKVF